MSKETMTAVITGRGPTANPPGAITVEADIYDGDERIGAVAMLEDDEGVPASMGDIAEWSCQDMRKWLDCFVYSDDREAAERAIEQAVRDASPKRPPSLADVAAALKACSAVLVASRVAKYTTFYDDGSAAVTLSGDGAPALQAAGATWSRWYDVDAGGQRRHLMADVDGVSFSVFESRTATDVEGDTQPGHKATKETR